MPIWMNVLALISVAGGAVLYNETTVTDFGTTTVTKPKAIVSGANYTTDEMVETSCHVISEQLVATATATVSTAFSELCRSDQLEAQLMKIQEKLLDQLRVLESKIEAIGQKLILYNNTA
ncbi:Hypothetical protein NTJ_11433 [Nesidiocoris tenuis]|uniref:TMhelix containing protein n=1 Tax=Nesidiocoris tenuis TaxID=355587 RepID=A0ABN7B2Y6_9HEMI|nr:Hypothetical protein NTJ_11433 [Nesidiocoris tenuis]